jgi:periplasmic protein TonB
MKILTVILTNFKVLKSSIVEYDEEAIRVLKTMPPWKPAHLQGKPVNQKMVIPVKFTM